MTWNHEAYRQLLRRMCRDSFWQFLLHGFGAYHNPKGKRWLDPSIHKDLCDWFEGHIKEWIEGRKDGRGNPLYLMVIVPRDVGKTTAITQAGVLWTHLQDPDISTYLGSERTEFAVDVLQPVKNILAGEDTHARFGWLYGNWNDGRREWKQNQIVHACRTNLSRKEPSFGIWGVESGITGKHPDLLCLDDPTSYEKLAAQGNWLQTVNNHLDSLIPVLPSDGCLIMVGTRYHDGDHFGVAIRKEKLLSISGMPMPDAAATEEGKWHSYFLSGRAMDGTPAIPSVWSEKRLKDFENKNMMRYSAQILNDPMNSENNPLPRETIMQYMVSEDHVPKNLRVTLHLDTAFKGNETQAKGDYSVILAMGHTQDGSGDVYFLGAWGSNQWKGETFGKHLILRVQEFRRKRMRVSMITDEPIIGGKSDAWEMLLSSWFADAGLVKPPLVLLPRGGRKKVARHVVAANFVCDGHVRFVQDAPGFEMLAGELSKIGGSLNDDFVDAFSDCFNDRCYNVMHRANARMEQDEAYSQRSPWDELLKTGRGNPRELLEYDLERYGYPD